MVAGQLPRIILSKEPSKRRLLVLRYSKVVGTVGAADAHACVCKEAIFAGLCSEEKFIRCVAKRISSRGREIVINTKRTK